MPTDSAERSLHPDRDGLNPPAEARARLAAQLLADLDMHHARVEDLPVAPPVDPADLRTRVEAVDLETPGELDTTLATCLGLLADATVHTTHPRYFGLFNPTPTFAGVLADAAVAAYNPQLAVWSHAPAAVEVERRLIRYFGARAGYDPGRVAGSFTTGGAEANLTAVLLALTRAFPSYAEHGLRALPAQPTLYASTESHLAWLKIAHACGLGREAVRLVPHDDRLRLDPDRLEAQVAADRAAGDAPFLAIATAGTTGCGALDPVEQLADVCDRQRLALHVDAAWAGALVLSDELRPLLGELARADSLTIDAHKWLSVPMGAGMFICQDAQGLAETFRVQTSYMPSGEVDDPYLHSIQWSRRFIGFKLLLSLAMIGRNGYAAHMERDMASGEALREWLGRAGWRVVNDTPLPLVCFTHPHFDGPGADEAHTQLVAEIQGRGTAWLSTVRVRDQTAVRACITSHRTTEADLDILVEELELARRTVGVRR
jgi:aromatic-L-amino-acid decarboxylase